MTRVWTRDDVLALGVKTDVPTAGAIIADMCRDQAYDLAKRDEFPVPVIKVGRRYFVPTAPIVKLLGLDTEAAGPPSPAAAHEQTARADERSDDPHANPRSLRALCG